MRKRPKIKPSIIKNFEKAHYSLEQAMKKIGAIDFREASTTFRGFGIKRQMHPQRRNERWIPRKHLNHIMERRHIYTGDYAGKPPHYRALTIEFKTGEHTLMEAATEFERTHCLLKEAKEKTGIPETTIWKAVETKEHPFKVKERFYNIEELEDFEVQKKLEIEPSKEWSKHEVMKYLDITEKTLNEWIKAGYVKQSGGLRLISSGAFWFVPEEIKLIKKIAGNKKPTGKHAKSAAEEIKIRKILQRSSVRENVEKLKKKMRNR